LVIGQGLLSLNRRSLVVGRQWLVVWLRLLFPILFLVVPFSSHRTEGLHWNHGRNFQRREHHNFGEKGFQQAPQMKARRGGAEEDGCGLRDLISGKRAPLAG
jgi:hypothetical protein